MHCRADHGEHKKEDSRVALMPLCRVPSPPGALFKRALLKSAIAIGAVLIFSIYSYAFHSGPDAPLDNNASLAHTGFARQAPVDAHAAQDTTPPYYAALLDEYEAPAIDTHKLVFDVNTMINISRGDSHSKELSLTFDGNTANHARDILNILRAKEIKTTIFLTGRFIRKNPDIVRLMLANGHEIGNHTMNHPHLTDFDKTLVHTTLPKITKDYFLNQILSTAQLYRETTGEEMAPYWRAPYGEINLELTQWAFEAGFIHVGWTVDYKRNKTLDTLDWVNDKRSKNYFTAGEIRERLLDFDEKKAGLKGGIILMHLGTGRRVDQAVSVLPAIIDDLSARGYSFVKISKMAGIKFTSWSDYLDETLALMELDEPSL